MSSPSTYGDQGSIATDTADRQTEAGRAWLDGLDSPLLAPVHALGFWSAVLLPFAHVPLLASGNWSSFLLLVAVNIVALLVGYPYKQR